MNFLPLLDLYRLSAIGASSLNIGFLMAWSGYLELGLAVVYDFDNDIECVSVLVFDV